MAIRSDLGIDGQVPMSVEAAYEGILPPAPQAVMSITEVAQAEASVPPVTITIELEGGNIARLPADTDISNVRANGADLEFVQPDGTLIVVPGGAIANLILFVGDVQIPAEAVELMFTSAGIEPAAGPEGSQGADGSSGSFVDLGEQNVGDGFRQNGLLSDTGFSFAGAPGIAQFGSNTIPTFPAGGLFLRLSEEGLEGGNPDTDFAPADQTNSPIVFKAAFGLVDAEGNDLTYSFTGIPTSAFPLTSGGVAIVWELVTPQHLVGRAGSIVVIDAEIFNADDTCTIKLLAPLDHLDPGSEDTLDIVLPIRVSDFQNFSDSTLTLTIEDDSPMLVDKAEAALRVDEDDIDTAGSLGSQPNDGSEEDGSTTGPAGVNTGGPATATGSLADVVKAGADGGLTFGFRDDATVRSFMEAQNLKSEGALLSYQVVGNVLYGFANLAGPHGEIYNAGQDRLVFTLTVTQSGSFTFELHDQLDHDKSTFDDSLPIDFGATLQAVDFDKDSVVLAGKVTVDVTDDQPYLSGQGSSITVDEDDIDTSGSLGSSPNDGNSIDKSFTGPAGDNGKGPANASGTLAGLVATSGADDGLTYGFRADSLVRTFMEAQNLKSEGALLSYQVVGNVLYGFANLAGPHGEIYNAGQDRLVFTLELNPTTGDYTFSLHDQIDHNKATHDASLPIDFGGALQALDFDKDPVTLTGKVTVNVTDDVPTLVANASLAVTVDEDDIDTGTSKGSKPNDGAEEDGSYTGTPGQNTGGPANATSTGNLATLVRSGADDNLTFGFVDTSVMRAYLQGLGLESQGRPLGFDLREDGKIIGFVNSPGGAVPGQTYDEGDRLVFEFELNANGTFTFSLHDQLDHAAGNGQNNLAIDFGAVLQATDYDGDSIPLTGKVTVNVTDDVPTLSGAGSSLTVDEDDIRTPPKGSVGSSPNDGNADGSYTGPAGDNGPGPANATGSLAGVVATSGADDPLTYGFLSESAVRSFMTSQHLFSEGRELSYQVVGNTLFGFVNKFDIGQVYDVADDRLVFELKLDPTTGSYTFSLYDQLDHTKGDGTTLAIDFGGALQALDFDKDPVPLTGKVTVNVTNDVPTALGESKTVNEDSGPLTIDLDANDSSGADGPLSIQVDTVTATGGENAPAWTPSGWTVNSSGVFSVTPPANWFGTLTVKYSVVDFDGDKAPATATITVNPVNDAPTIHGVTSGAVIEAGDIANVNEAGLTNPSAPSGEAGLEPRLTTSTSLSGLQTTPTSLPTVLGSLIAELGGTALAKAQAVAVIWDYLDDIYSSAGPNQANVNEAFVRLGMEYAKLVQSGHIQPLLDVVAKYTPDGADADLLPDRVQNLHDNLLGNLSSAALAQRFHATNPTLEAQLAASISLIDADLLTRPYFDGAQGANDAAVRAWDLANGFATTVSGQLTVNDPDQPSGHVWSPVGSTTGTYGSFSLDANGKWTYVLDNKDADTQALKGGQVATETFAVRVTDAQGDFAIQAITINVTGSNDAPVITSLQNAGGTLVGVVEANEGPNYRLEPSQNLDSTIAALLVPGMNMAAVLDAVQAALGAGASRAQAIVQVWDYIDDNYSYYNNLINEASARLAVEYAKYLRAGGVPLLDVVGKFTVDGADTGINPDRQQTLHDNILGNAGGLGLADKLLGAGSGGSNPSPAPATYQAILDLLAANDLTALLDRPYFGGYEGETNTAFAWDVAHNLFNQASGQITVTDVDQTTGVPFAFTADHTVGTYGNLTLHPTTGAWSYAVDPSKIGGLSPGQVATESFVVTVTDEKGGFDTYTITVAATGLLQPPTTPTIINAPSQLLYWSEGHSGDQTYVNRISFQDADSAGATVTVTLSVNNQNDDLTAAGSGGVSVAGSGTSEIVLTGTLADINAFIGANKIAWNPEGGGQPSRNLTVTVDDNGAAAGGNVTTQVIEIRHNAQHYDKNQTDNSSLADTNINLATVDLGSGSNVADSIVTSWSHGPQTSATEYKGGAENGGSAVDTITLVFQASQLEEILINSTYRGRLDNFLSGSTEDLDLGATSWNAKATNFEDANLALAAGNGYVLYQPANSSTGIPDFDNFPGPTTDGDLWIGNGTGQTASGGVLNSDTENNGNDILVGLAGDDTLWGGAGDDLLLGGAGNDIIRGGNGNDVLSGGLGADDFVFTASGLSHTDKIVDYSFVDGDRIDLGGLLDAAFGANPIPANEIANYVQVTQSGNDVTISVDTNGTTGGTNWSSVVTLVGYGTSSANDPINIIFDGVDHTFKV